MSTSEDGLAGTSSKVCIIQSVGTPNGNPYKASMKKVSRL